MVLHLATQHELLKEVSSSSSSSSTSSSISSIQHELLKEVNLELQCSIEPEIRNVTVSQVMQKDKRPGVAAVFKALYPEEGEQKMVQDMVRLSSEPEKYFDFLALGEGCRSCGQCETREEDWRYWE